VPIAIATDLVGEAVEDERLFAEGLERLQDFLEGGELALLIRPEGRRDGAVGGEDEDDALLALGLVGESEAGQVEQEGHGRGADAEIADEFAAVTDQGHTVVSSAELITENGSNGT
jgi:hypothetical protein